MVHQMFDFFCTHPFDFSSHQHPIHTGRNIQLRKRADHLCTLAFRACPLVSCGPQQSSCCCQSAHGSDSSTAPMRCAGSNQQSKAIRSSICHTAYRCFFRHDGIDLRLQSSERSTASSTAAQLSREQSWRVTKQQERTPNRTHAGLGHAHAATAYRPQNRGGRGRQGGQGGFGAFITLSKPIIIRAQSWMCGHAWAHRTEAHGHRRPWTGPMRAIAASCQQLCRIVVLSTCT